MKLSKQDIPFTMVANEVLRRNDISFQVKGLFAYLFSKPEGWEFSADRIAKKESKEDRKTIQRILKSMEEAGLLERKRQPDGKMDYIISYATQSPKDGLRLFGDEAMVVADDRVVKTGLMGRVRAVKPDLSPIDGGKTINELIGLFEPFNPSYKRLFANKTQRAAIQRMLMEHGEEKVRQSIALAGWAAPRKFGPTITTPIQLESKLGDLIAFAHKEKGGMRPATVSI